jgi:ABC-type Fe3+/spermidine/putrescine transport system ATPase subunit
VLLLDEPLSALDLKIRLDMEAELRRVHRETGATFLYVTHDQGEALALSDRVVVFSNGRIEQVGSPTEIYHNPASTFAAQFVGDANVVPVTVESVADGEADVALHGRRFTVRTTIAEPGPAWLVVRAEAMNISATSGADDLSGTVVDIAFRGSGYSVQVDVPGIAAPLKADMPVGLGARFNVGDTVAIGWDGAAASLIREAPC